MSVVDEMSVVRIDTALYLRVSEDPAVRSDDGLHVRHPDILVEQHVVEEQDLEQIELITFRRNLQVLLEDF
jgi:hypothetical protein